MMVERISGQMPLMMPDPSVAGKASGKARANPAKAQAVDIQASLHEACLMLRDDLKDCSDREERARVACAIASSAKGWQSITDQLRILRGQPSPGSLRPVASPRKAKRSPVQPTNPDRTAVAPPTASPVPDQPTKPDVK